MAARKNDVTVDPSDDRLCGAKSIPTMFARSLSIVEAKRLHCKVIFIKILESIINSYLRKKKKNLSALFVMEQADDSQFVTRSTATMRDSCK